MRNERKFLIFVAVWCGLVAALVIVALGSMSDSGLAFLGGHTLGVDDANIYFRYARHVGAMEGIVWNVGGERVEGVTSLLWLAVCVVAFKFSERPEELLFRINIVLATLSMMAAVASTVAVAMSRRSGSRTFGAMTRTIVPLSTIATVYLLWWISQSPPFIVWNILSLLDTGLWSALVILLSCGVTVYSVFGNAPLRYATYTVLVLLVLARPEGGGMAAFGVVALTMVEWLRGATVVETLKRGGAALGIFATAMIALYSFRLVYFGYPLPNTYYAKVDGDLSFTVTEGWRYVTGYAATLHYGTWCAAGLVGASIVAFLIAVVGRIRGSGNCTRYAFSFWGLVIVVGVIAPVLVGGDHFNWWRFLTPYYLPVGIGLLLCVILLVPARLAPAGQTLLLLPLLVGIGAFQRTPEGVRWSDFPSGRGLQNQFGIALEGREVGAHLNEIFRRYPTPPEVGALAVGGIGVRYEGPVYDLLALNNVAMAHASSDRKSFVRSHAAFNAEVFLRDKPAFLFFIADYCDLAAPQKVLEVVGFYAQAVKHVHQTPEFQALYVPVVVWDEVLLQEGRGLCGYALREELASGRPIFGYRTL